MKTTIVDGGFEFKEKGRILFWKEPDCKLSLLKNKKFTPSSREVFISNDECNSIDEAKASALHFFALSKTLQDVAVPNGDAPWFARGMLMIKIDEAYASYEATT